MVKNPKISNKMANRHDGETAISLLDGTVVGIGKDAVKALTKAKKKYPQYRRIRVFDFTNSWSKEDPYRLNFLTSKAVLCSARSFV